MYRAAKQEIIGSVQTSGRSLYNLTLNNTSTHLTTSSLHTFDTLISLDKAKAVILLMCLIINRLPKIVSFCDSVHGTRKASGIAFLLKIYSVDSYD